MPFTDKRKAETVAENPHATRETVESIAVAIILAFLFRGFVAEAFVIPTGSMAPTLRGRHMDIECPQCAYRYLTGASSENDVHGPTVDRTTCPVCHFTHDLDKARFPNQRSFNGDRILVSKFAYQLAKPERWDVIVFKYPGNAKQNYIKRLIGLPGETIRIRHGDVHLVQGEGRDAPTQILRKPPFRVKSMLQLVDDSNHVAQALIAAGVPPRWQQTSSVSQTEEWHVDDQWREYSVQSGESPSWLRYRHLVPRPDEWRLLREGVVPRRLQESRGELITDYYAYNQSPHSPDRHGTAWVGDLALECRVEVESSGGELLLDLVEAGAHFECRLDTATGQATLSIREFDGSSRAFVGDDGSTAPGNPTASTAVRGPGSYHLRFSNCDDQLLLWVNNRVVEFDMPATFQSPERMRPHWSRDDEGDLTPLGIGAKNLALRVRDLKVHRDIYYLAAVPYNQSDYGGSRDMPYNVVDAPERWEATDLFDARMEVDFKLDDNQYFPLGDNSPQSKDARLWWDDSAGIPPYVDSDLLIGKALLVYWPHGWRPSWPMLARLTRNFAFIPNFPQMKLIR